MTNLRKGQVRLGPRTWAIIREAYLNGASGASLAETYGCSLGTIRMRARDEGWRRCDAWGGEAAPPVPHAAEADDDQAASPEALAEAAVASAARALRAGRPSEAAAYMRVAEAARRVAAPDGSDAPAEPPVDPARRAADAAELRRKIARRMEHILQEEREAAARGEAGSGWIARQLGRETD